MKKLLFFLTVFLLSGIFATKNYSQSKANTKKADYQDPKNWGPGWNNTNGGCKVCDSVKNFSLPTFIYQNIRYPIVDSLVFKNYGSVMYAQSFSCPVTVDSSVRFVFPLPLLKEQKVVSFKKIINGQLISDVECHDMEKTWRSQVVFFLNH